jgi:hypothetical protein
MSNDKADIGLFDSATGKSLEAIKVVDVTNFQDRAKRAVLLFTQAQRGRIVQLQSDGMRIHYFLDEDAGKKMMEEDSERFGFHPGRLLALATANAPPSVRQT